MTKQKKSEQTNQEFARVNEEFKDACTKAGIAPTKRQASKWRLRKGAAWEAHRAKQKK